MAFRPLNSSNAFSQNINEVNNMVRSLNKEQTVKTFKQANGNAIVSGKLPGDNGYGEILYKTDGTVAIVRSNADWDGDTANIVKEGKLPYSGGYGQLNYDATDARILIGIDPDGDMNIHISKAGEDVVTDVFS